MKLLILILCLVTFGCTSGTRLYNPATGAKLADFTADMDESQYAGGGVTWNVKGHRPSRNTRAKGKVATELMGKGIEGVKVSQGLR